MKTMLLQTADPKLRLVEPDVERDAPLGVEWLKGKSGRKTLHLMGVSDDDNKPTTVRTEQNRVQDFISRNDQLNWMIEYEGMIIGTIWVNLTSHEHLSAPSVSIMIGNPAMRGKGIGSKSMRAVVEYMVREGNESIYSRHITDNVASRTMLQDIGFKDVGGPYKDKDGLAWQNVSFVAKQLS